MSSDCFLIASPLASPTPDITGNRSGSVKGYLTNTSSCGAGDGTGLDASDLNKVLFALQSLVDESGITDCDLSTILARAMMKVVCPRATSVSSTVSVAADETMLICDDGDVKKRNLLDTISSVFLDLLDDDDFFAAFLDALRQASDSQINSGKPNNRTVIAAGSDQILVFDTGNSPFNARYGLRANKTGTYALSIRPQIFTQPGAHITRLEISLGTTTEADLGGNTSGWDGTESAVNNVSIVDIPPPDWRETYSTGGPTEWGRTVTRIDDLNEGDFFVPIINVETSDGSPVTTRFVRVAMNLALGT